MPQSYRFALTPTPPVAIPGFYLHTPKELPPCPECGTGELFRYMDRPTRTEEIVCLECGHVIPDSPAGKGGAE